MISFLQGDTGSSENTLFLPGIGKRCDPYSLCGIFSGTEGLEKMSLFSKHLSSIKVPHHKDTAGMASVPMPVPEKVYISMSQNIGRPCQPLVKKGDHVLVGQLIGDSDAPVSAPVYASASGEVIGIETERSALGGTDTYVIIQTDGEQTYVEGLEPPVCESREDFIAAVRASGVVGLGGASFPTHIKLNPASHAIHVLTIHFTVT